MKIASLQVFKFNIKACLKYHVQDIKDIVFDYYFHKSNRNTDLNTFNQTFLKSYNWW